MSISSSRDLLNRVLDKVAEVANEAYLEFSRWVDRLDDMEKLFFMVVFILILFMLILVRAGRRKADPARGRSFVSSIVLVMLFSFGAGWMIDSRFDVQDVMNFF
ncbi:MULTISPECIES: hypothetical protein [unclassified Hyphomonas]|jgi:hypothetical protein|uniref:hypothetical protein n=1 Tax=unclassified Hyphomonas TaxID=2630699 RepID=UPI000E86AA9E|nr:MULTISPECIES: hypothetical protein [unclassified Hyphomonas]HBJ39366.1 hypothetical protein [Hyphomonas sp.]HCX12248.1 hypothetical protein [Hyphomonas sp.]|tara:strand:+ start:2228 stop:2539 length:312 start_codon:yes stop_codon:yes gene_type:complete